MLNLLVVPDMRSHIYDAHGIGAITAAMSAHTGVHNLQRAGCCIFWEIVRNADAREHMSHCTPRSIRCVLVAMHTFQFDEILQQAARQYLRCLAANAAVRVQMIVELQSVVMDGHTRGLVLDIFKSASCGGFSPSAAVGDRVLTEIPGPSWHVSQCTGKHHAY
jgi:hypothetical protein